jgi:circadian clock protein KaiC
MTTATHTSPVPGDSLAQTGIDGLDDLLRGGLPRDRVYLVDGDPGTGKTTFAMQFLMNGARRGEPVLYVTLSETEAELRSAAASHGFDLTGITIYELTPSDTAVLPENQYTVFHPSEVELGETTKAIMAVVDRIKPRRVVFDSLSEMRLLARDPLRYRRQILAVKQLFTGRNATVILLDDRTSGDNDLQLQSLAHGVIRLEQVAPEYGMPRRRLRIVKLRGVPFEGGYHDMAISTGGLVVYPRAVPVLERAQKREAFPSGVPQLDTLFGGGLDRGTTVLFMGPAGVGKSALGAQFAVAAAKRQERAAVYLFDESVETYCWRASGMHCDVETGVNDGIIKLRSIDPSALSPGEFVHHVRSAVEDHGARVIVLDSLNGYLNAMPQEQFLLMQLHELFMFLRHRGVLTIVIMAQQGLVGQMQSPIDLSYLADTVVLMRYFEAAGEIRQAISVMKKRSGPHERTIREFKLDSSGIRVGEPLTHFHGVLTGVPSYTGTEEPLIGRRE